MAKTFYAVRKGNNPGIYNTWSECQVQVVGFSGAEYKKFTSSDEAKAYIRNEVKQGSITQNNEETEAVAYVDGSYNSETNQFSCGVVIFYEGKERRFSERFDDAELAEMNNVAGELKGAETAIQFCLDEGIKSLTIYHDYEGISKWCTEEWQAKKKGTKEYKEFYDLASKQMKIQFVKVKSHSGDKYNELADQLAKDAFKSDDNLEEIKEEKNKIKSKGIFIDQTKIKDLILSIGTKKWESLEVSDLKAVGNAHRCNIIADGKTAMLNFYFKKDGTTTITPSGKNLEISSTIKVLLEEGCEFHNSVKAKSYSFKNIPEEWVVKLIEYLTFLDGVKVENREMKTTPQHDRYKFTSKIGDTLTVNVYKTGTLTLQGKPAYLYSEAISLLSYCNDVSMDDIVDTVNIFHSIDIKTSDVRDELRTLLPRSYGNIDEMILKLLSPSISLRKIKIELEDYSCYAFPALRALEGYIKYLFSLKNVYIGNNFYKKFNGINLDSDIAKKIGDTTYKTELECLYEYLIRNRHVLFHAEQILIGTTILEDKREADEIVNNVLNLIETSYTNINS